MHLLTLLLAAGLPVLSGPDARLQVSFEAEGHQLNYCVAMQGAWV